MTGTYIYDSAEADSDPLPDMGSYQYNNPPYGISLEVGGFTFMTDPANTDFVIGIMQLGQPVGGPEDSYSVISENNMPLSNGVPTGRMGIVAHTGGGAFSTDELSVDALDLSQWSQVIVGCGDASNIGIDYYIEADVTSMALVPEPATILLLTLAIPALRTRRRITP